MAIAGQMICTALLAALRHRDRHGVGQLVTLALKDVGLAMLGHLGMLAEVQVNGVDRPRYGNHLYGAFGCDFCTRDGERVMVVGLTPDTLASSLWESAGACASNTSCSRKRVGIASEIPINRR